MPSDRTDRRHLAFLRQLPCLACGSTWLVEAAHVSMPICGEVVMPLNHRKGASLKVADRWAVPLCKQCHMVQHSSNDNSNRGEQDFWARREINPLEAAQALYRNTGNRTAALGIIQRRRNGVEL